MTKEESLELAIKLAANDIVLYGPKVATVRDEGDDESQGGIIIPEDHKRKPLRGRVVVVGMGLNPEDKDDEAFGMQVGDLVHHTKYNPTLFELVLKDNNERIELEVMHIGDIHMGQRD